MLNCPISEPAQLQLNALGDFPVSNQTGEFLSLAAVGTELRFPAATLAVEATVTPDIQDQVFIGYSERNATGLDFLLWPKASACEVFRPGAGDAYPGKPGGEALGYSSTSGLVMIAGSNDATSAAIVGALTFDTRTGESHVVDPGQRAVLAEPRAFATVTDFNGKILVAGGEDPIHDPSLPASTLRDTAEVYDPTAQRFEPDLVALQAPRTRHAAISLDSGETMLVGGLLDSSAKTLNTFVEVVSPATRSSHVLAPLSVGRIAPAVLRLSDGRILVAAGSDADEHPIGALEWRGVDASPLPDAPFDGTTSLPARYDRAFAALPGGAVLAVGGCEDRAALPGEDCAASCNRGCPPTPDPTTQQSYDAFWIGADGSVSQLDFPLSAPRPILLPGSDGRPWLIADTLDAAQGPIAGSSSLYRFNPWSASFEAADVDLGLAQTASPPRFLSTGPDTFLWLAEDANGPLLSGARFGTRSAFTSDLTCPASGTCRALVASRDADDPTLPAHLAPDHPPGPGTAYDGVLGALQLAIPSDGSAAGCVWIADASYSDFSAQVDYSTATAPTLRLGEAVIAQQGAADTSSGCILPPAGASVIGGKLTLRRRGAHVSMQLGSATSECDLNATESESTLVRRPFAVCQSLSGPVTVTSIAVTRGG